MAESANPNPTPKQRFLGRKDKVNAHNALMNHAQLMDSIETALLEQQRILTSPAGPQDGNSAASGQFMLRGAQHFVDIFLKLSLAPTRPEQAKVVTLDHNA